jgi:hypothetical protein
LRRELQGLVAGERAAILELIELQRACAMLLATCLVCSVGAARAVDNNQIDEIGA